MPEDSRLTHQVNNLGLHRFDRLSVHLLPPSSSDASRVGSPKPVYNHIGQHLSLMGRTQRLMNVATTVFPRRPASWSTVMCFPNNFATTCSSGVGRAAQTSLYTAYWALKASNAGLGLE